MLRRSLACGLALLTVGALGCDDDEILTQEIQRFQVEVANVSVAYPILKSGAVATPVGATEPGPLMPGDSYIWDFTAGPGMRLNLATMFTESNDLFYAFPQEGIPLYGAEGTPLEGNLTGLIRLYDAGTEENQEPGVGPGQPEPGVIDVGTPEEGTVAVIPDGSIGPDGFAYPSKADVIDIDLEHMGDTNFRLTMTNVSTDSTLPTPEGPTSVPLSPFVYAIHVDAYQLYDLNQPASPGLERLAEDGVVETWVATLEPLTGLTVPLSPVAFAIHVPPIVFFDLNGTASEGIENIAESGNPDTMVSMLSGFPGVREIGAIGDAPAAPGESFTFEVDALPGSRLSLATMFAQSNDLFYAFGPEGVPLFDSAGRPISGEVTNAIMLWDAGTEIDEEPGVGLNQAPRQDSADSGTDEGGVIMQVEGVDDGFEYPMVDTIIRVTVTPL